MKRSKQAQKIIDTVNDYLRNNHIKSESNEVFLVFNYALIQAGIYNGYNWFTDDFLTDYLQFF